MFRRFDRFLLAAGAAIATLIFLSGCNSGGEGGSGGVAPPVPATNQPVRLPATPADIPSAAPRCTGSTSEVVFVPASLRGLVSACASQSGDTMLVTNLSDLVLDVTPGNNSSPQLTVKTYNTLYEFLLPDEEQLEIKEQNAAVAAWRPASRTVFLPVGGHVVATSSQPVHLAVQEDQGVSATSLGAELLTAYVVNRLPEDSVLSYYPSIASCVSAAYKLWGEFTQPSHPSAAALIQQAIETLSACEELEHKLATELSAEHPDSDRLHDDLATEEEHAEQKYWQSETEDAPHDDFVDIR